MEAQIVSGLKRSATGRLAAAASFMRQPGNAAPRLAVPLSAALLRIAAAWGEAGWLFRRAGYWLGSWALRRSVSPKSLAGISLLFAICGAAWFSAGNGASAIPGLIAAGGWLITLGSARRLDEFAVERATDRPGRDAAGEFAWIAALCSAAAECALYGGIAAGGAPGGLDTWPLAVITVSSIAVAEVLAACRAAAGPAHTGGAAASQAAEAPASGWRPSWPHRLSVGGRALFAAAGYLIAGPSAALFAVAGASGISIVVAIATLWKVTPPGRDGSGASGRLLALRDDGTLSRRAGRLVQGTLLPLPPALAGFIATVMLTVLGLRNLPGFIALTPPVVMMLAAPGSGHPHDGRFDWLVPALLAAAQFVYFGALGFALSVPGQLVFAACSLTFVWYASLTRSAAGTGRAAGAALTGAPGRAGGWETRLFMVGIAAALEVPSTGYAGLAAYLAVLSYRKVSIGSLMPQRDGRR